jgi:hypothetical protein
MTYPKEPTYLQATFEDGYSILYEAHEANQPRKWMASFKVRKGSLMVFDTSIGNVYDSREEAERAAYDIAVGYMEDHASGKR